MKRCRAVPQPASRFLRRSVLRKSENSFAKTTRSELLKWTFTRENWQQHDIGCCQQQNNTDGQTRLEIDGNSGNLRLRPTQAITAKVSACETQ